MSERKISSSGFLKAYAVNLLLQVEWLLLAGVLLALHFFKGLSIVLFWAALGFWLLLSLVVTWFVTWAAGCETPPGHGAKCTSERLAKRGCSDVSAKG